MTTSSFRNLRAHVVKFSKVYF